MNDKALEATAAVFAILLGVGGACFKAYKCVSKRTKSNVPANDVDIELASTTLRDAADQADQDHTQTQESATCVDDDDVGSLQERRDSVPDLAVPAAAFIRDRRNAMP